ncbi:hypothetical protein EYV94_28365 [Puteibacter caeruleilacunae]|nr:hypothetical protein EYV94_28365 [Puteibacter caeruleilacunae]
MQFFHFCHSNHADFSITGNFDNPTGLATTLALVVPICYYSIQKYKHKMFNLILMLIILVSIILSESRTAILASISLTLIYWFPELKTVEKNKKYLVLFVFLTAMIICFIQINNKTNKINSVQGRKFIYYITLQMIKDCPILGHGEGAFEAKYMEYQSNYFKDNINSKYENYSDNIKHPFNEILKLMVEYGVIFTLFLIGFTIKLIRVMMKNSRGDKRLMISMSVALIVCANLTYVFEYASVKCLLFIMLMIYNDKHILYLRVNYKYMVRWIGLMILIPLVYVIWQDLYVEYMWNKIAMRRNDKGTDSMFVEYEKLLSLSIIDKSLILYNYSAELNICGQYKRSISIIDKYINKLNDYDVQMLLGNNYENLKQYDKALEHYQKASLMIPSRFICLYQQFRVFNQLKDKKNALRIATIIKNKEVKIKSKTIDLIKEKVSEFLDSY